MTILNYDPIQAADFRLLLDKTKEVQRLYPQCVIMGGTALRFWCHQKGMPVPRPFGNDIDIGLPKTAKPVQTKTSDGEWIDAFPVLFPLKQPFYDSIRLAGEIFTVPSPAQLLFFKAQSIRDEYVSHDKVMAKDLVYFPLLKSLVLPQDLQKFETEANKIYGKDVITEKLGCRIQELIEKAEHILTEAVKLNKISPALHPDEMPLSTTAPSAHPGSPTATLAKNDILKILEELPKQIHKAAPHQATQRLPLTLLLGGGASLALRGLRETTTDLDMLIVDKNWNAWPILKEMPDIIERTSASLGFFHDTQHKKPYIFYDKDPASQLNMHDFQDFFEPHRIEALSPNTANVGLAKRELLLAQKIGIIIDTHQSQYRAEIGKLERDKQDARNLCESLGIRNADNLDTTVKSIFQNIKGRDAATLPNFPKALEIRISSGMDVKDAWHIIHSPPRSQDELPTRRDPHTGTAETRLQK